MLALGNYDDYDLMARKGRKHVIRHFNWNKISKEYEDIIIKNIRDFHNANI